MKEEITEELIKISPNLAKLGNRNPFLVPDGYFETLSAQIESECRGRGEASVPSGYFDALPDQVMSKVVRPKTKFFDMPIRRWATAASVIAICCVSYWISMPSVLPADAMVQIEEEIDVDESLDFLISNGGLYTSELSDLIADEDLEELGLEVSSDVDVEFILSDTELDLLEELL